MKKIGFLFCLSLSVIQQVYSSQGSDEKGYVDGFQIGLGAGYNTVSISQSMSGLGISNLYSSSGTLVAQGQAGGITVPFRETKSIFSPQGEMAYSQHLSNSPWFFGGKFLYQYLGLAFSDGPMDSPQSGAFTTVSGSDSFFGNAIIQSSQTLVNHELFLMPFFGHSIQNTHFYLGGGAALFQATFYQYNFIGFADVGGAHNDITGNPVNFENSLWMWGGGGQIGATHYFNDAWFIDIAYMYLVTANYSFRDSKNFTSITHTSGGASYNNIGQAIVDATQRIIAQSLTVSLNLVF